MLALPVIAMMSLGVPASAAPTTNTQVLMVETGDTSSASGADAGVAPLAVTSYISNENNIGIGVSKNNTPEPYQAILPGHRRTDGSPLYWDHAHSFYIGPGYCAQAWYWQNNAWRLDPRNTLRGPVEAQIVPISGESVARWAVRYVRAC
ncbi:hypothetical protein ACIQVC_25895 [Streptomyces sp. NPDC101112]|uniref:hypothetical protein n=1 Tax=Streptomyces sp. NPDC101112 TaxID=3366105 RepID=UPI003806485F